MNLESASDRNDSSDPVAPLLVPADIYAEIVAHCLRESPLECCGLIGGVGKMVLSCHPLGNLARSETRYEGDPKHLVEAWRWLREHGQEILAIYHSHPRWQAIPSATDRSENYWGELTHIIVSLQTDPPTLRAWRLYPDSQRELPWTLIEPSRQVAVPLPAQPGDD
jgi:proteasome lid subunit RPN8/RPN11